MDDSIERAYRQKGYTVICGCDEAGRGPLAGPVCAAAVIMPEGLRIEGLNDSKKLSEKKREALYDVIREKALGCGIAFATEREIDEINILNASLLAMRRAIEQLPQTPDLALIDGNRAAGFAQDAAAIVKGDATVPSIAAASVLAKVTRDRFMAEMDRKHPGYGFAVHKGYPTPAHYAALRQLGPCEIHRVTFLKKMH